MRKALAGTLSGVCALFLLSPYLQTPALAAAPSIYESMSGSNGTTMTGSGSSDSIGFTGNWSMVNANKNPGPMTGVASYYRNSNNSKIIFPVNSRFTRPANNTAASTVDDTWNLHYSARQMTSGVNFDSNGTFYMSFLGFSPVSVGSWGSYVVGLLKGLPTSTTDASKAAIYVGRSYSGGPTIQVTTANVAVWNPSSYSAVGTANNPAAPDGNAWFIIAKFTTAASGNDNIQLKFYSSTDTVPTSDSGISWDVSYQTALTGSYGYLGVQAEYNGTIDEIRGGSTYEAVSGMAISPTIGTPTVSGDKNKGVNTNIVVSSDAAGYLRFYANGKRIAGCLKVSTAGTSPSFTATCNWKPATKGPQNIYAEFTSSDVSYLDGKSPSVNLQITPRSTRR